MTWEQYYALLAERWAQVDQENLQEIRAYNRWRRMMRQLLEVDDDE